METCNLLGVAEKHAGRLSEARAWYERSREIAQRRSDTAALDGVTVATRFTVQSLCLHNSLRPHMTLAQRYDELLASIDGVEVPCADDADHRRSWFVYVVALPDNETRERAIAHFEREGIGYNRYLPSIHLQPYMRERYGFREGMCPVSEDASSRTLALPFYTALERDAQERVAEALVAAL